MRAAVGAGKVREVKREKGRSRGTVVSYDKLWKLLIDRKMKKKDLREATSLSSAVIAKMGRGEPVHLETLMRICGALHCRLDEVVDINTAVI